MVTAVVFSATLTAAVAPPPFEVMTGALSLTFGDGDGDVLDVGIGAVRDLHLHVVDVVAAGVGGSLGVGAETNSSAPVVALIVNLAASAPPTIE